MNEPNELEGRLRRAMHSEADATSTSPDALVRIRARTAPKSRAAVGWLRPAAAASALAFTLVAGTLAGVKIAGSGGGAEDNLAEPPSVIFNPAASGGPSSEGDEPDGEAPAAARGPDYLPGFDPSRTIAPSPGASAAAILGMGGDPERTHNVPEDTGGSYVGILGPDSGATVVGRTVELSGIARVFEANVVIEVSQNGSVVKRDFATASSGAPELGNWTKVLALEPGNYRIDAFEESMEGNGTRLASDTIWITVAAEPQGATGDDAEPGAPVAEPVAGPVAEPVAQPEPDPDPDPEQGSSPDGEGDAQTGAGSDVQGGPVADATVTG